MSIQNNPLIPNEDRFSSLNIKESEPVTKLISPNLPLLPEEKPKPESFEKKSITKEHPFENLEEDVTVLTQSLKGLDSSDLLANISSTPSDVLNNSDWPASSPHSRVLQEGFAALDCARQISAPGPFIESLKTVRIKAELELFQNPDSGAVKDLIRQAVDLCLERKSQAGGDQITQLAVKLGILEGGLKGGDPLSDARECLKQAKDAGNLSPYKALDLALQALKILKEARISDELHQLSSEVIQFLISLRGEAERHEEPQLSNQIQLVLNQEAQASFLLESEFLDPFRLEFPPNLFFSHPTNPLIRMRDEREVVAFLSENLKETEEHKVKKIKNEKDIQEEEIKLEDTIDEFLKEESIDGDFKEIFSLEEPQKKHEKACILLKNEELTSAFKLAQENHLDLSNILEKSNYTDAIQLMEGNYQLCQEIILSALKSGKVELADECLKFLDGNWSITGSFLKDTSELSQLVGAIQELEKRELGSSIKVGQSVVYSASGSDNLEDKDILKLTQFTQDVEKMVKQAYDELLSGDFHKFHGKKFEAWKKLYQENHSTQATHLGNVIEERFYKILEAKSKNLGNGLHDYQGIQWGKQGSKNLSTSTYPDLYVALLNGQEAYIDITSDSDQGIGHVLKKGSAQMEWIEKGAYVAEVTYLKFDKNTVRGIPDPEKTSSKLSSEQIKQRKEILNKIDQMDKELDKRFNLIGEILEKICEKEYKKDPIALSQSLFYEDKNAAHLFSPKLAPKNKFIMGNPQYKREDSTKGLDARMQALSTLKYLLNDAFELNPDELKDFIKDEKLVKQLNLLIGEVQDIQQNQHQLFKSLEEF